MKMPVNCFREGGEVLCCFGSALGGRKDAVSIIRAYLRKRTLVNPTVLFMSPHHTDCARGVRQMAVTAIVG
jgi:hypothetical protein